MITFICKRSGNKVSFDNPDDIAQLRVHEGYLEVKNEIKIETTKDANENANEENANEEVGARLLEIPAFNMAPSMEQPTTKKKLGRPKKYG